MASAPRPKRSRELNAPPVRAINTVESRLGTLPRGLRDHVERARAVGRDLALVHGVDVDRVDFALAAHDLFRGASSQELISEAAGLERTPDEIERAVPWLLHGPVAARWLRTNAGVEDRSILSAIEQHTTFAPHLDALAMVVFLADKLDPDKVEHMPDRVEVRDLAYSGRGWDATRVFLRNDLTGLIGRSEPAHPRTLDALNWLLLRRAGRKA